MLLNGYLLQGISSIRLWEGYLHPTNYFVTILESDVNYSSVTESWPSTRHAPDRRKCHNSQSESCTESYWPMRRQEMHSEGSIIISVIVISVSTALWFPTSAPPSPLTSETHKKRVITISYLSQWSVICCHRTPPGLTWPRCRWGWGWSSRSSCRQWAHWSRQTPWLPPSRSTPGVSGWCSCSPGWLLSSPNAKHHQSLRNINLISEGSKHWAFYRFLKNCEYDDSSNFRCHAQYNHHQKQSEQWEIIFSRFIIFHWCDIIAAAVSSPD